MSIIPITKADLLRAIDTEEDWWRAVLDLATQTGPLTGNEALDGTWTFKELLAHITGWRVWTLARLQAAANGNGAAMPPWPAGMDDTTEEGTGEINAWFTEQSHVESLATGVDRLNSQLAELRRTIARMSDDDLFTPGRFVSIDP
mgnify:CR=1 FL=1